MRHGLCPPKNLHSGQEYKYINNSKQQGQGSVEWSASGTEHCQGQNWSKGVGGGGGGVGSKDVIPRF